MRENLSQQDQEKQDLINMYLHMIENLMKDNDYSAALAQLERVLQLEPHNILALDYKKRIESNQGASNAPTLGQPDEKELLQLRKQEKLRELEEQRRKIDLMRKEFEDLQRMEEQIRKREEEQARLEEQRRREAERLRKEEEERKRREEEEHKRQEELRQKQEHEERRKKILELQAMLEQLKNEEQHHQTQEEKRIDESASQKADDLLLKQEEERKKREEEQQKREGEERKRKEELRKGEEGKLRKVLEEKKREEELRKKEEEERKQKEELRKKEEEEQNKADELRRAEEERAREETRKRREAEKLQQAERMKKIQDDIRCREEELRKQELERQIQNDPGRRLDLEMKISQEKQRRLESSIITAEEFFSKRKFDDALDQLNQILDADPHHVKALTLRQKIRLAQQEKKKQPPIDQATPQKEFTVSTASSSAAQFSTKSSKSFLPIILGILLAGAYFYYQAHKNSIPAPSSNSADNTPSVTETTKQPPPIQPPAATSTNSSAPKVSVEEHVSKARQLIQKKNYLAARQEYEAAIDIEPNRSDLYTAHATIDFMLGKYTDAIQVLTSALKYNPADTTILQSLSYAHQFNGTIKNSLQYHETLLGLVKDSTRHIIGAMADAVFFDESLMRQNEGRMRAAFDRWTKSHPKDFTASYRYARMLMALGAVNEAVAMFQKIREFLVEEALRSNDPKPMIYLALSLSRIGFFNEAEGFIQDAKDQSKVHPEVLYQIARMYSIQMIVPKTKAANAIAKDNALKTLREAVAARFLLSELMDADFLNLRNTPEFSSVIRVASK